LSFNALKRYGGAKDTRNTGGFGIWPPLRVRQIGKTLPYERDTRMHQTAPGRQTICAIGVHVYVFIVRFFATPLVRSAAAQYLCATGRIKGEQE